jgi:E3 ubiquitin-protein ligase mind-bomb
MPDGPRISVSQTRSLAKKAFHKGIYPGAKIIRGKDWAWQDQDGGCGKRGKVVGITDWNESSRHSGVMVEWDNGLKNMYRLGYGGKVDLKVVKETKGGVYYREHLPLLGETKVRRRGSVAPGDYVRIAKDIFVVREKQVGHGGWNQSMMESMGNVGRVVAIDNEGDAVVAYPSGGKWTFNPYLLTKVIVEQPTPKEEGSPHKIKKGDFVKISGDIRQVKRLQQGHGEWAEPMRETLGRVGQIASVFPDGDIKVKMAGQDRLWTFNPECVTIVEPDSAPLTPSTTEHLSEMLRTIFETHTPTRSVEGLVNAAANGNLSVVMEILKTQQCGVNDKHEGQTALHVACQNGHIDVIKYLLSQGAKLEVEDKQGAYPIHYAAVGAEPDVVKFLAQEGADVNVRNRRQQTPLHMATVKGHMTVIRSLLSLHCHASLQDLDGDTPLHDAISKKREDIVELLMEYNADPSVMNKNGFNCIHLAALKGSSGPMRMILSRLPITCSVDDIKEDGFTALHLAALNNHRAVAELLLENGASRNVQNLRKAAPLHLAIERQNVELVRLLVDSGADPNVQDKDGRTPLHEAVQSHMLSQLKRLTGSASDLTVAFTGMTTPTEKKSSASIASFLVSQGADPYLKNKNDQTPIDLCSDPNLNRILLKAHQERQM